MRDHKSELLSTERKQLYSYTSLCNIWDCSKDAIRKLEAFGYLKAVDANRYPYDRSGKKRFSLEQVQKVEDMIKKGEILL